MAGRLLIATANPKKRGEMTEILGAAGLDVELLTLTDFPPAPDVEETGETFLDNARLKARAGLARTGIATIADDSGLVIDALDGQPGVLSHRFLGMDTPFPEKMAQILEMLRDVPDANRTARFVASVVIAAPDGREWNCEGTCEGQIAHEMRGGFGFGYDPILYLPERGQTLAELSPKEKHSISHRGRALACAVPHLRELFG